MNERQLSVINIILLVLAILSFFALLLSIYLLVIRPDLVDLGPFSHARESISSIASVGVVFGTILLAYATFVLSLESKRQEKQRRADDNEKEKKAVKERYLTEIINWAASLSELNLSINATGLFRNTDAKSTVLFIVEWIDKHWVRVNEKMALAPYLSGLIVKVKDDDLEKAWSNLGETSKNVITIFDRVYKFEQAWIIHFAAITTNKNSEKKMLALHQKRVLELTNALTSFQRSTVNVIKKATYIKTDLL